MAGEGMRSVHVIVRGTVQGVGFRWFVSTRARALQLAGWVRNMSDGRVELVAQGDAASVERLLAAVREGPSRSSVDETIVDEAPADTEFDHPFDVRR
jgi:acylphosphatase